MHGWARLICLLLASPSFLVGQADPPAGTSWLHQALLDRSQLIVVARWESDEVTPLHGIQMTRFTVEETLKGAPTSHVLVGNMGDRGNAFPGLAKILFLRVLQSRRVVELVDVVDITATDEGRAPALVRSYLALGKESNPIIRARQIGDLCLRELSSGSIFTSRVAAFELLAQAESMPFLFEPRHMTLVNAAASAIKGPVREPYQRLQRILSGMAGAAYGGTEKAFPPGVARDEFLAVVGRFQRIKDGEDRVRLLDAMVAGGDRRLRLFLEAALRDRSAGVRRRATWHLGEMGEPASLGPLATALEQASEDEQLGLVEAIGKVGHPEAVAILLPRLADPATLDTALLAIARSGGLDAENVLERTERALAAKGAEKERWERIRYYRSKAFRTEEEKRRQAARKDLP